jgi:hypothetical protein
MDRNPDGTWTSTINVSERFEIVRLFNELRNTPPIGAVGLREFRDLLASLFPEFDDVRDEELDEFLNAYVQETMSPRTPERDWEKREDNSRHNEPEGNTF